MDDPRLAALKARLDRWECEKRYLLGMGGLMAVVALALAIQASVGGRSRHVVEADGLVLRDDDGRIRAELSLREDGTPHLAFYDTEGRDQFLLDGMADDSTAMTFLDSGRPRINLASTTDGSAVFNLFARDRRSATGLYMWPDSTTGLAFRNGDSSVRMAVGSDGTAGLAVSDENGAERGKLGSLASEDSPFPTPAEPADPAPASAESAPVATTAARVVPPAPSPGRRRREFEVTPSLPD